MKVIPGEFLREKTCYGTAADTVPLSCSCIQWSKLSCVAPSVGRAPPSFSSPWISSKRACRLCSPPPRGKACSPHFTEELVSTASLRHRSIFTVLSQLAFCWMLQEKQAVPNTHGFCVYYFLWIFFIFDISGSLNGDLPWAASWDLPQWHLHLLC